MNDFYEITIAGCTRRLSKYPLGNGVSIAAFILFGDVEITEKSAEELLKKCPDFDAIVTPEAKSIPLAYEMSRQSGKKYFVARKGLKVYMGEHPLGVSVNSITTQRDQRLYLSEDDAAELEGKRILIVDDVISTGNSLKAVEELVEAAGGIAVGECAVLAEGDAQERDDIIYLEPLPVFFD